MHSHFKKLWYYTCWYFGVLILVVMEDALAQICVDGKDIDAVVLILVVMEDALAPLGRD